MNVYARRQPIHIFRLLTWPSYHCSDNVIIEWNKALGKLGNIVVETFVILDVSSNVSLFAHPWKHRCGNKICFPRSKNVS